MTFRQTSVQYCDVISLYEDGRARLAISASHSMFGRKNARTVIFEVVGYAFHDWKFHSVEAIPSESRRLWWMVPAKDPVVGSKTFPFSDRASPALPDIYGTNEMNLKQVMDKKDNLMLFVRHYVILREGGK